MNWTWKTTGGLFVLGLIVSFGVIATGAILKLALGAEIGDRIMAWAGIAALWCGIGIALVTPQVEP